MSMSGAYWGGALFGVLFSGGLAVALSLVSPLRNVDDQARLAEAPAAEITITAEPEAIVSPEVEASLPTETEAEAEVVTGTEAENETEAVAVVEAETETATIAEPAPSPAAAAPVVITEPAPAPVLVEEPAAQVETAVSPDVRPEPSVEPVRPPAPLPTPAAPSDNNDENTDVALLAPTPEQQPAPAPAPLSEAVPAPEPAPEPETTESVSALGLNTLPPYKANAILYRGDASQPLLAIVLTGVGGKDTDSSLFDDLLLMPGPLAIVIEPTADDPANIALDIRDAGFEALVGMDQNSIGDAEPATVAREAMLQSGEVIGVAVLGASLASSDIASGLVNAAEASGMAVLDATRDGGSVSYRMAAAKNLPAAATGRRFDEVSSSAMVFQSLERAAFDARRTGAFVVVADATPTVLAGLRRWMNVKANKTVSVAPLSAVIDKIARQ